jgi:DNA polymerase elongation subunit (family B)
VVVNSTGAIASAIFRDGIYMGEDLAGTIVKVPDGKVLTVRDVFDKIKRALNVKAYSVEVTYDEVSGYPKEVHIDYDRWTTDDVDIFYISNVIPL